jgi:hypothetical protein
MEQNLNIVTMGQRNKLCSRTFTNRNKHIKKGKGPRKTKRSMSLKEASFATMERFKLEMACILYKTINTFGCYPNK